MSAERPEAYEDLIPEYLEAYERKLSLENVRAKSSGFFVSWIIDHYNSLPEDEVNKAGKTASAFRIPETEVYASRAYYDRHKDLIDARIFINKVSNNPSLATAEERDAAEQIIGNARGEKDPLLSKPPSLGK